VFVTRQLRLLAGGATLVVGMWYLSAAPAAPELPNDSYKKVIEADIAQIQQHLDHIVANLAANPKEANRYGPTTRGLAMMLASYAEATGDEKLKTDSLKLAETLGKKQWKDGLAQAKALAAKGGGAPLKSGNLHTMHKFLLEEVMSPYRGGTVGGMNIEKEIRAIRDKKVAIDPAAIEILAARVAVLNEFAIHFPNDKAQVNKAKTDLWIKLSKESVDLSKKLVAEASKGKKANEADLQKTMVLLDAKCATCHKEFRDD
jgi:cytochrome c556